MRLAYFALMLSLCCRPALGADVCSRDHSFKSPDGVAVALVSTANVRLSCGESRVQLRLAGRLVADKSFGSPDGQQGYGFVSGRWTSDSRFFVFDLMNSGGHEPLYSPIFIFDAKQKIIVPLTLPESIIPSSFRLSAEDNIAVEGWDTHKQVNVVVKVSLKG